MEKEIKNKLAYDINGNIVTIYEAEKGKSYFCPVCKEKFVVKNSGKTGKGSRCAHFSHPSHSDCNESVLHAIFKQKSVEILKHFLPYQKFPVKYYGKQINLLDRVERIEEEHSFGQGKPRADIALIDAQGECIAVLEIVVYNKPKDKTLKHYDNADVVCLVYNVEIEHINSGKSILNKLVYPDRIIPPTLPTKYSIPCTRNNSKYVMQRGRLIRRRRF